MYTNGLKDRFGSPLISQREINTTLGNYILKSDLSTSLNGYALKSELDAYAKTSSLGSYVLKTELTDTLGGYVTKNTYDSFVSTTNTELGKRGSLASANTWSGTNTFSGTLNKTSSTSSPTDNSILNKGENDDLYAPISVTSEIETLGGTISGVSTVITSHSNDKSIHVTAADKESLTTLVAEKDNFVNKNDDATLSKTLTVTGGATFDSTITKSTNTSSPTATSVLNKGETDALYAPKSLSTTVSTLNNTVSGFSSTYVPKTTYDSFVSSTNGSISTINTTLGNTAKTNTANTFTGANTFNSTATVKGAATFGSTITKSTNTSNPTTTSVLNKGETDALYAPKSLVDTVDTLDVNLTTVSTTIAEHETDESVHVSATDKENLTALVADKDNFVNKNNDATLSKTLTVTGNATFSAGITKSNNTSSPTATSVLNKGETDSLYAPKSLSTTVTNLSNTVNGLGSTYVAKTTYDSFVSSTNSSISTINTTLGNTAKTNTANTFTGAITFNSTTNSKGDATFGSNIIKSTTASDPSTATATHVLNKGENDKLYAPKSVSDTVETLGTKLTATSTVIASHQTDTSLHVSSSEKEGITSLISNKDNFANKTEDTTFAKSVTVTGGATFGSTITKSNNTTSPTNTTVLNKGETDALYAPKSLSTTVTNLSNTVNGLGSTYVAKTTYDTFVSNTNTSLGNCAKTNAANTFSGANTFNSTTNTKGAATFGSTITKSTTTSNPTDTSVLNKGENDDLYAPISLSTTVTNLSNTVNGLGSTYVAKTTYDSFVTSTNNSISTLNTNVGKCALKTDLNSYVTSSSLSTTLGSYATTASLSAYAKVGSANTFTAANTFNSTTTTKGAATFNSTITKTATTSSPADTAVLNKGENDALYAPKSHVSDTSVHMSAADRETLTEVIEIAEELTTTAADFAKKNVENTFVKPNTFKESITTEGGINAMGGDIFVANGVITFEDLIDGTVVERSGASGYQYVEGIPTKFNNGVCYDIGTISNTTDLSAITFSSEGRLVQTCELWFTTPATVPTTHKWPANIYWIDSATGAAPTLIASKNYRLVFRQEPNKIIASIAYLY